MTNKLTKTLHKAVKSIKSVKKEDLSNLKDLFLVQMRDLYDTEKQIAQALPKVIKKTDAPDLKKALENHLKETNDQIDRLEKAYDLLDMKPERQQSMGMKGLIDDGKEVMGMKAKPELMDAAITANAKHIEHHEIAGYKSTIEWAKLLDLAKVVPLLEKNLEQEERMEHHLTTLAKKYVNDRAVAVAE